ncbi:hypothetical protein [Deinococcus ruber]|uniref:Uncharacterized protein n=1 Tax=Deinococcus ruber TaxID=1848197 RepID=A0A918BYL2_9DEIO|nr:hypothetical protein [Deinococcus ruber]GGQ98759.1 hypothetical protein GCM10008957_08990 [Deinococcus ruber]
MLLPLRTLALAAGVVLYIPDQRREGWYFRVSSPEGADLKRSRLVGEARRHTDEATAAVLACTAVDRSGGRLSKGFGWAARGLDARPAFTLAHARMVQDALPCPPDSRVSVIGTPAGCILAAADTHHQEFRST